MSWGDDEAMNAEPPQRAGGQDGDRRRVRRALWFAGVGVAAGLATAITSALGDIGTRQAIIVALPAALLTFGGLAVAIAAAADPERAERQGFRAGLIAGTLVRWWRLLVGPRGRGRS
jgi:hypothetical protein